MPSPQQQQRLWQACYQSLKHERTSLSSILSEHAAHLTAGQAACCRLCQVVRSSSASSALAKRAVTPDVQLAQSCQQVASPHSRPGCALQAVPGGAQPSAAAAPPEGLLEGTLRSRRALAAPPAQARASGSPPVSQACASEAVQVRQDFCAAWPVCCMFRDQICSVAYARSSGPCSTTSSGRRFRLTPCRPE